MAAVAAKAPVVAPEAPLAPAKKGPSGRGILTWLSSFGRIFTWTVLGWVGLRLAESHGYSAVTLPQAQMGHAIPLAQAVAPAHPAILMLQVILAGSVLAGLIKIMFRKATEIEKIKDPGQATGTTTPYSPPTNPNPQNPNPNPTPNPPPTPLPGPGGFGTGGTPPDDGE